MAAKSRRQFRHNIPEELDLKSVIRPHHNVIPMLLEHTAEIIFVIVIPVLLSGVLYVYSLDKALWEKRLEEGRNQADELLSKVNISELTEQLNQHLELGWESLNENMKVLQDVLQNVSVTPENVPTMYFAWWQVLFAFWLGLVLYWLHQLLVVQQFRYSEKPVLWCQSSPRNNKLKASLLEKGPGSARVFTPTLWAVNAHVQSFMFCSWPAALDVAFFSTVSGMNALQFQRRWVEVPERYGGGAVSLEWVTKKGQQRGDIPEEAPVLFLLPGVIGSAEDLYLRRVAWQGLNRGWRVCGKNWRGLSVELVGDRPETWDHQSVIDMEFCLRQVRAEYPRACRLFALGFSTGGIVITTYMGMHSAQRAGTFHRFPMADPALRSPPRFTGLHAGVNLSGLTDSERCAFQLETTGWPPYSYGLSQLVSLNMAAKLAQLRKVHKIRFLRRESGRGDWAAGIGRSLGGEDDAQGPAVAESLDLLSSVTRTIDYHNAITRHFVRADPPVESVTDYYRHVGKAHGDFQGAIEDPLLCVFAEDDPLCTPFTMQQALKKVTASPGVFLLRTKTGGHCGFFSESKCRPWADDVGMRFLQACLDQYDAKKEN